jgi:hypothetical protein
VSDINGHPVQVVFRHRFSGDHGENTRNFQRSLGVDGLDPRVGERAADDVQIEHARQLDVVHVMALAAYESRILLALDRVAHASDFGGRSRRHR